MRKAIFLILLILLLSSSILSAKEQDKYLYAYLLSYPHTVYKGAKAPLNWKGRDWLKTSAVLITASALYVWDEDLRDIYQRNRTEQTDDIMTGFKQFGEGKYIIPALGLTVLGGYLSGSEQTTDTGMLCVKSFVLSQAVTQTLKLTTARQRPSAENGKEFWNKTGLYGKRDSFPSGHTTLVWSLAPILASQYKESTWVAPTVYSIATFTSLSRLNDNRHWSSDVFVGAVVGYVAAKLVLSDTPRLAISPNPQLQGISFDYRF
ncbi:MAG: phosphatase PAP2 family protein [Candidatus Cloacimonetes bacterium]|nr:phosphatase PAP2 family protein [Candidatus Cloacimonadota bacterium]